MAQSVLILGANGKFGGHAARAFEDAGWTVTRFDRMSERLEDSVKGMDVVVNGWNPSDYSKWTKELVPMHEKVLAALAGSDTTVIVIGNVYVYGDQTGTPWSAATPHRAVNVLGQLRVDVEAKYRASGVRTILLRGGDFIDTCASGNWFDKVMVQGLRRGTFTYPGRSDIAHAWAYLPDFARAAVALAARRDALPVFADIAFPGYTLTGVEMAEALGQVTGQDVRVKPMWWGPIRALGLLWPMLGCLSKMRYLWDTPHQLDGSEFDRLVPGFQETPVQEAFAEAIAHLELPETRDRARVFAPAE